MQITWYEESGLPILEHTLEVKQHFDEPWLLLEEVLNTYPYGTAEAYSHFLLLKEGKESRLYTPYQIRNREGLQKFRERATAYAKS